MCHPPLSLFFFFFFQKFLLENGEGPTRDEEAYRIKSSEESTVGDPKAFNCLTLDLSNEMNRVLPRRRAWRSDW